MPATETEMTLLRFKTKRDEEDLPDSIINMLFDEAEVRYAGKSRQVIQLAVRVEVLRSLVAEYRVDVSYKQNETSENLSDIAKGYAQDLAKAESDLEDLLKDTQLAVGMGATRKVPKRNRETPW